MIIFNYKFLDCFVVGRHCKPALFAGVTILAMTRRIIIARLAFFCQPWQSRKLKASLKNVTCLIISSFLCLLIVGCISTKYVEHKQYLFAIKTLPEKSVVQNRFSVYLAHVTAVPPYDQVDFLYRISTDQYLTDYYHGFLVPPTEQLKPILVNYLKAIGKFQLDTNEPTTVTNKLHVQLTEFYADYRDRMNPQAIITLRFNLTQLTADGEFRALFDKAFREKIHLKAKDTSSLLAAWNQGLQNVVTRGVRALNAVIAKETCEK